MSTGDVDRKRLWGRSGSRCAFCNRALTEVDGVDSIVGDEAHIRSEKAHGPRHEPGYSKEKLKTYENLILLCKVHHKLVDDNEDVFTTEVLQELKAKHERRVKSALEPDRSGWLEAPVLRRVDDGTRLISMLSDAQVYSFSHDHPDSDEQASVIGSFLQDAQDWADIAGEIGPAGRTNAGMSLHQELTHLGKLGLHVYAGTGTFRLAPDFIVKGAAVIVRRATAQPADADSPEAGP
jgi:hypothetical protein